MGVPYGGQRSRRRRVTGGGRGTARNTTSRLFPEECNNRGTFSSTSNKCMVGFVERRPEEEVVCRGESRLLLLPGKIEVTHRDERRRRRREIGSTDDVVAAAVGPLNVSSRSTAQSGRTKLGKMTFAAAVLLVIACGARISQAQQVQQQQKQQQQQRIDEDSRCFLDGGGSTETFFIRESLEVGSLLGTLRVIGRPGEDIDLSLAVRGAEDGVVVPLEIEAGTKNLRLTSPLDKEGETGPAAVSVDVLCQRVASPDDSDSNSNDPAFSIPVDVRVTDVNDNAPLFVGAPYSLNLSELAVVGSEVFDAVRAIDSDQPGPFSTVEYHVQRGKYSDYLSFQNPLEGTLMLTKHLDFETVRAFRVGILARDQGSPPRETRTTLTVNVRDADDQNPAFAHDRYEATLPDDFDEGAKLMVRPADIRAKDKDEGLGSPVFYEFSGRSEHEQRYFELNRNTGLIYVKSSIPEDEFLQPVTLVVKATQFDNADRYAVTTLTVSRGGIYDTELQFLRRRYEVKVLENVPLNSVVATLLTNRPSDRRVRFTVDGRSMPGGEFSVNEKGDVVVRKVLDFERTERYEFAVSATDGRRNDSAVVLVDVLNINDWDPRFKYPQYEFFVASESAADGALVGRLEAHDGDKGDAVTLDVRGADARLFRINKRGELFIDDLNYLNSSEAHIVVVAEDSGIPPRRASVPVLVRFAKEVAARIRGVQDNGPLVESGLLFVIFGGVIVLALVVILLLSVYICKSKRKGRRVNGGNFGGNVLARNHLANLNGGSKTYLPPELSRESPMPNVGNPVYRRGDMHMLTNGSSRPPSGLSRRSSTDTLSSVAPPSSGPQVTHLGVALNPLNPRSASQRYSKVRTTNAKVSPVPSNPTPSIHSNGLPEPPTNISADPNGRQHSAYAQVNKLSNGAVPRHHHHGSVNSVASSSGQNSLIITPGARSANSESSLQQALRENILASASSVTSRDVTSGMTSVQHRHSLSTRIEWPRNSIPRRVKKLSWEDEGNSSGFATTSRDRDISTLTDPNVSVTPLSERVTAAANGEAMQIGRAIYF